MERHKKIELKNLRCGFEKYRKDPRLMALHRKNSLYKRVKESLSKEPLVNPLIVYQADPPYYADIPVYDVRIGNNRYLAMLELDNYYLGDEIDCIITDDNSPANLKRLQAKYKNWKGEK